MSTTRIPVGVDYCTTHHGIRNEDERRCDNAADDLWDPELEPTDDGEPRPCELHECFCEVVIDGDQVSVEVSW